MEEIGVLLLFAGLLGLVASLRMLGRPKRRSNRFLLGNFDFAERKDNESRR